MVPASCGTWLQVGASGEQALCKGEELPWAPCPPAGLGTVPLAKAAHSHPTSLQDCFPGPGTYGPQGNPYTLLEERDKRSASTRGLMDSGMPQRALPAAVVSPAPCPGDMLVGWPCPPAEHSPCCLSSHICRAAAWDLAPTTCPAASTRGCGGRPAPAPASSSRGTGRSPLVVAVTPWRCVVPGPHTQMGFLSKPWHCQHTAVRMESCFTPASVPLGFCSLTSPGSWKKYTHAAAFGE